MVVDNGTGEPGYPVEWDDFTWRETDWSGQMILGMDVSRYQMGIHWDIAALANVRFAYIKATEGTAWSDPYYEINWDGARVANIIPGMYHYFKVEKDPKKQAAWFYDHWTSGDVQLPPAVDVEDAPASWMLRRGRKSLYEGNLYKFIAEFKRLSRVKTMVVYSRASFIDYQLPLTNWLWRMPLWIAHYYRSHTDTPREGKDWPLLPREWTNHSKTWTFWQFSADGNLQGKRYGVPIEDGGSKSVDLNVFKGTYDDLVKFCEKAK